jgi:hypothetical protein
MNADTLLVLIFGVVCGFGLGWPTAWRLARKLEHHGVQLSSWDKPFDLQAPEPRKIIHPSKFGA